MEDGYRQIFINKVLIRKHETTLYKHFRPGFAYDVELHKKDVGISLHFQPVHTIVCRVMSTLYFSFLTAKDGFKRPTQNPRVAGQLNVDWQGFVTHLRASGADRCESE